MTDSFDFEQFEDSHFQIPTMDESDLLVIAHAMAHFSSSFSYMHEYYEKEGVGCIEEISLDMIEKWIPYQELALTLLPPYLQEEVDQSLALYDQLKQVYEHKHPSTVSILLSNLILTEEEEPLKEMAQLAEQIRECKKALLDLIKSHTFYSTLNPGYGRAPAFAARILAEEKITEAIPFLFDAITFENHFTDEAMLQALEEMSDESYHFLKKKLQNTPITKETEKAAMVLTSLPIREELSLLSLSLLQNEKVLKQENLAAYLIMACEKLPLAQRQEFIALEQNKLISKPLKDEINLIIKQWK